MGIALGWLLPYAVTFGLLLVRCGVALWMVPALGGATLPALIRGAFSALLALVLTLLIGPSKLPPELWSVAVGACGELVVGLSMGLVVRILIYSAEFAGGMLGLQMGLAFANVVDPMTNESGPITSQMLGLFASMVFVALDGHRLVLVALALSAKEVSPGDGLLALDGLQELLRFLSVATVAGAKIAAPVVVALFLANVALGLLARAAPQLQLFMLSFGISIGLGVIILRSAISGGLGVFGEHARQIGGYLSAAIGM